MKKLTVLIFSILTVSVLTARGQLTLNEGEAFEYSFSTLPGPSQALGPLFDNSGGVILVFNDNVVNAGGSVRFELFEEGLSGTADRAFTIDLSTQQAVVAAEGLWADRDGSFRVTALTGSLTFDGGTVIRGEPGLFPSSPVDSGLYQIGFTAVPEPSTIALGFLGAAALLFWKRK